MQTQDKLSRIPLILTVAVPVLSLGFFKFIPFLLLGCALVTLARRPKDVVQGIGAQRWMAGLLLAFLAVTVARIPFAVASDAAASLALDLALLFGSWFSLTVLMSPEPDRLRRQLAWVMGVTSAVLLFELAMGHPLTNAWNRLVDDPFYPAKLNRPVCILTVLLPLALTSSLGRAFRAALAGLVLVMVFISGSEAAKVALLVMAATWVTLRVSEGLFQRALVPLIAAALLLEPLIFAHFPTDNGAIMSRMHVGTVQARLHIYQAAANFALERPLLGWGPDSSNYFSQLPDVHRPFFERAPGPERYRAVDWEESPIGSHPHNGVLEIAMDYGIVGLAFLFGFLALVSERLRCIPERGLRQAGYCAFIAFLAIGNTAWGLWQMEWLCMTAIVALLLRWMTLTDGAGAGRSVA